MVWIVYDLTMEETLNNRTKFLRENGFTNVGNKRSPRYGNGYFQWVEFSNKVHEIVIYTEVLESGQVVDWKEYTRIK